MTRKSLAASFFVTFTLSVGIAGAEGGTIEDAAFAGDYNGNGVVEQADLDLALLNWGADGSSPPSGWVNDFPNGQVDQEELDNVLLNWGSGAYFSTTFGDFNGNGVVEQADLDLVLLNWGANGSSPPSGWVHDFPIGQVDQEELDNVLLNWGSSAALGARGSFSAGGVPEPSTLLLALVAVGVGCCLTRRLTNV